MSNTLSNNSSGAASARRSANLSGTVIAPGDKSISHRAIIFGALADGETTVRGLLEGADIMSTVGAMKAFGAEITQSGDVWRVKGCGKAGLTSPQDPINCGNA